jgi:hypothetical protein
MEKRVERTKSTSRGARCINTAGKLPPIVKYLRIHPAASVQQRLRERARTLSRNSARRLSPSPAPRLAALVRLVFSRLPFLPC